MSDDSHRPGFRLALLATGGTIEKTYDAHEGTLTLAEPVIEDLLDRLVLPDVAITLTRVMTKDSLDMGQSERAAVCDAAKRALAAGGNDALIITHGTDTLAHTAVALAEALVPLSVPVVLTGAMRPYRVAASDAAQNVAQAIMAARLLAPGVYAVLHGRVIPAGQIRKDYARLTFVAEPDSPPAVS